MRYFLHRLHESEPKAKIMTDGSYSRIEAKVQILIDEYQKCSHKLARIEEKYVQKYLGIIGREKMEKAKWFTMIALPIRS